MQGKKQFIIYGIILVFIIILISSMMVYAKNQNQDATLEEKVTSEINYLSQKLIGILNKFNGFSLMGYDIRSPKQQSQTSSSKDSQSNTTNNNSEDNNDKSNTGSNESNNTKSSNTGNNNEIGNSDTNNNGNGQTNKSANNNSDNQKNQILIMNGNYTTDWDTIEYQIEEIYHTWSSIVIDLHALNVNSDSILKFSDILNQATQQIKKKNKNGAMEQLANLYQLLTEYADGYQSDDQWSQLLQIKSAVMFSYCFASNDQWEEAKTKVQETIQLLTERLNFVSTSNNKNQSVMNKVYILAHELNTAINQKDKEIFFIHYCSMVERMELL